MLKAGKFYVVLDPTYPADRLAYMLADSGAGVVVMDTRSRPLFVRLAQGGLPSVNLDELDEGCPGDNLDASPAPDALAMLLYTSGSTGNPKGVMHSHRNVLVEVRNLTNAWCVGSRDRWLLVHLPELRQFGPHDLLHFPERWRTLSVRPQRGQDSERCRNGLRSNGITILRTLPTTFRNFMAVLSPGELFPDVRVLSIGGEPMYRSDVDAFNDHFAPSCTIAHGLGPTECFMVCMNYVPHGTRIDASKLQIGLPFPDKDVLLLDEGGREVPVGEVGEICVRSRYIALGYWRDAERTRAAFLTDPQDPAGRIYRTGDLGTRAADGCLTHVGRRDFQVKIRGFRVDVSEVEVAMRTVQGVKDAVVVGREDTAGEKRLVAYYVASTTPPVTAARIRRSLAQVLPDFMVPTAITRLDAMPLTPGGKNGPLCGCLRRRAQPPPLRERLRCMPSTALETRARRHLGGSPRHRRSRHSRRFLRTWRGLARRGEGRRSRAEEARRGPAFQGDFRGSDGGAIGGARSRRSA